MSELLVATGAYSNHRISERREFWVFRNWKFWEIWSVVRSNLEDKVRSSASLSSLPLFKVQPSYKNIIVLYNLPKNYLMRQICTRLLNIVFLHRLVKFVNYLIQYLTILTISTICISCLMGLLSRQPFNFNMSTFSKKLMNILFCSTMTEKNKSVDSSNKNCESQTIIFEMEITRNVGHCFYWVSIVGCSLGLSYHLSIHWTSEGKGNRIICIILCNRLTMIIFKL